MLDTTFQELRLDNPGVLITKIPDSIFALLQTQIQNTSSKYGLLSKLNAPQHGTGGIEKVFHFDLPAELRDYVNSFAHDYINHFDLAATATLGKTWVNVMEKHEYNAVHAHGYGLTFVIWIKIPYDLEAENNHKNSYYAASKKNSRFEFIYSRLDGFIQTKTIPVDRTYEGTIVMFPSYLGHVVYPFYTSDDVRISLSGNFTLQEKT